MPILTYATLAEVPEDVREDAVQKDGKFEVNLVSKKKVDEFRTNNISLSQERDTLKTKVEAFSTVVGGDIEKTKTELTELRRMAQQVKDGTLKASDAVEAEIVRRTKELETSYQSQLAAKGTEISQKDTAFAELSSNYNRSIVDREVTNAVLAGDSGVNPAALSDILTRAYSFFSVVNGVLVAKQGSAIVYGADGVTPLKPKEWLVKVLADAPYLGKQSAGGGGSGGAGGGAGGFDFGMSEADFDKLPPEQRIALFRKAKK